LELNSGAKRGAPARPAAAHARTGLGWQHFKQGELMALLSFTAKRANEPILNEQETKRTREILRRLLTGTDRNLWELKTHIEPPLADCDTEHRMAFIAAIIANSVCVPYNCVALPCKGTEASLEIVIGLIRQAVTQNCEFLNAQE